jgi:hypothetical protein
MQFANFEEFWAASGRLYDEILEIKESIRQSRLAAEKDRELMQAQGELMRVQGKSIGDLAEATQRLLTAVEKHQLVVESHERRIDRTGITVEAILEDLRRHREQRPSQ